MRRVLTFSLIAVVFLSFAPLLLAQTENCLPGTVCFHDVYQLVFYDNAVNRFRAEQTIRIVNPGLQGSPISSDEGSVCAAIYVFDDSQNMEECCSCPVSANDLLQLSLGRNLLQNPAVGRPNRGVIKIVSQDFNTCDPRFIKVSPNLRSTMQHIEMVPLGKGSAPGAVTPSLTDTPFEDSGLSLFEIRTLESKCSKIYNTNACTCS